MVTSTEIADNVSQMVSGIAENTQSDDRYTRYTVCLGCGEGLGKKRPQAAFCSNHCRYAYHNERRRKRKKESLLSASTKPTYKRILHPTTNAEFILIRYRKEPLAFTLSMYKEARRLGRELTRSTVSASPGTRYSGLAERIMSCLPSW